MAKKEIETQDNGHDDQEYQSLLDDMRAQGLPVRDAADVYKDGIGLLQMPEQRHSNASLLASVPNVSQLYDKKEKDKGILLDLMARTYFRNREEFTLFLKVVDWLEEFVGNYDWAIRYAVGVNSENGRGREQYTDAITTFRFRNYQQGGNSGFKPKAKYQDGQLS